MAYYPDMSPYCYDISEPDVLNVGWLDASESYSAGDSSLEFRTALEKICRNPILLHRGHHVCSFCGDKGDKENWRLFGTIGNGQIRVRSIQGRIFSAPTMIHHYVTVHQYKPPDEFISAVIATDKSLSAE